MTAPLRILIACDEKPCPRGSIGQRDKNGRCKCPPCKEIERQRKQKWAANNRDKVNAYSAKWRAENPEKRKAAVDAWRYKNPDRARSIVARAGAKWSKKRRDKRAAIRAKSRARAMKSLASWANLEAIETFYIEAARLTDETGIPHEVDHVIPLNGMDVCGLHVETNLQIITRSENRKKGRRIKVE